jgi:hypothetical protein
MGIEEYSKWSRRGYVDRARDWTEAEICSNGRGYPLSELKRWVDLGGNSWGKHDIVARVEGLRFREFALVTRDEHFGFCGESDDYMLPLRYKNISEIDFERLSVIYDPRSLIGPVPVVDLALQLQPKKSIIRKLLKF